MPRSARTSTAAPRRLFPPLEHATPVKRWIGFRPRSVEGDGPHIGRVEGTNVWLAYGHYRNGILLTPVTAQRIADEISVFQMLEARVETSSTR